MNTTCKRHSLLLEILFVLALLSVNVAANAFAVQDSALIKLQKKAAVERTSEAYLYVSEYLMNKKGERKLIDAYMDSAYHAAQKEKSDFHLGVYYRYMSELQNENADPNSQELNIEYGKKSLAHFRKAGVEPVVPYLCMRIGIAYFSLQRADAAIPYFKEGLQSTYANPDNPVFPAADLENNLLRFLTLSYKLRANNDSTLYYAKKHEEACLKTKDSVTLAQAQYNIASAYDAMNRHPDALNAYLKAAKTAVAIRDYNRAYSCYSVASTLAETTRKLELARLALKYAELVGEPLSIASSWSDIGGAYVSLNEAGKAIEAYRKAMEYNQKSGNEALAQMIHGVIMNLYAENNQHDSAWAALQKIEEKGELPDDPFSSMDLYFDSIQSLKTQQIISGVKASTHKVKLDVLQKQYLEQENKSLKHRVILIFALSVLSILALLLLYNRQRQKRKAEQAARYAREKEKEFDALQKETEIRLTRKYIDGLESERERIAKELHDGVCNDLLALEMSLKQVTEYENSLKESLLLLTDTRTTVRNISHDLMPPVFQYESLHEILVDYTTHLDKPGGMSVHYESDTDREWTEIPQTIAYTAYRIIQELLSNSIKHSKATRLDVRLTLKEDTLSIEVSDNGVGFDTDKTYKGIGLHTVAERAKGINGQLDITSGNRGTRIEVSVKIEN